MLEKFVIEGPTPLKGSINVSGSKNAALPLLAASLLADGPCVLQNIPRLQDIYTFSKVISATGTKCAFDADSNTMTIDASAMNLLEADYELVRRMRASFYMLGAFLGHSGHAKVSLPGGCAWGPRPVDLHIKALEALGAEITLDGGYVYAKTKSGRLQGGSYYLEPSSVGATVNFLLGAVKAEGKSTISNAAMEPDVVQLGSFLNKMGAKITGLGTPKITVQGVDRLKGITFRNDPDRIEAGTFMIAAAMHPESDVVINNLDVEQLGTFADALKETGAFVDIIDQQTVHVKGTSELKAMSIVTKIYPGFPTDLQAQWAILMTQAKGSSKITDTIYTDRFSYVPEISRLGAKAKVGTNAADITGPTLLSGATVMSTDLRASVSLVMAAMMAKGKTEVLRIYHLDRGYEDLEKKLNQLGAKITRLKQDA